MWEPVNTRQKGFLTVCPVRSPDTLNFPGCSFQRHWWVYIWDEMKPHWHYFSLLPPHGCLYHAHLQLCLPCLFDITSTLKIAEWFVLFKTETFVSIVHSCSICKYSISFVMRILQLHLVPECSWFRFTSYMCWINITQKQEIVFLLLDIILPC